MADQSFEIAVDQAYPESDFDASSSASERTSLRSSVCDYIYENGRRYHAYHAGEYWGSNDEKAMDAMDILFVTRLDHDGILLTVSRHHVYSLMLNGKLYLAPIPANVDRVLDIGTGTGKWAIDFADSYPSATVIGTDLSPIQPNFAPPNVRFEIDDCCDEWLYKRPFDFVHARGLFGCVKDWDRFYSQAFQHLAPGGYIEQVETAIVHFSDDGSLKGTRLEEAGKLSQQAAKAFGKSFDIVWEMKDAMIRAGFSDVTERCFKLPVGPWPKDKRLKTLGRYERLVWEESMEMWVMMLYTKVLGMSREEVELLLADVRKELYDPNIHFYQDVRVCYGRKPATGETTAQATS